MFRKGTGAGYHETKDFLSKEIRFGTMICPRSNMERISKVFLDFAVSTNNSKCLDFFKIGPSQIAMIRSNLHYFGNPRTQSYGYVK